MLKFNHLVGVIVTFSANHPTNSHYNEKYTDLIMPRIWNIILALFLAVIFAVPVSIIAILIYATSRGPAFHWSSRVGKNNVLFLMPKFRTMYLDAPDVATHLLDEASRYVTPVGGILIGKEPL